jgi:hypothetical protein
VKSLEDIIFADDRLPGEAQINFAKAQNFKEACEILEGLKAKGFLDYEAEDPSKPLSYHTIQVKFNFKREPMITMDAKEISELLSKVDKLLVDSEPITGEWQLGSRLWSAKD